MMRYKNFLFLLFSFSFFFSSVGCQSEKSTKPITLRQLAYAMNEDVYKITLKTGKTGTITDVRVRPEKNMIKGYLIKKKRYVTISISKIEKIEKVEN